MLAESNKDKAEMDNHKNRDEVLQANKKEFGMSIRHSHTLNKDLLYEAKKFSINGKIVYVRMAKEIRKINDKIYSLGFRVAFVLILFFAMTFYFSYKISINIQKETKNILRFLLDLTKKRKNLYIDSSFSIEFNEITKLLSKVSRILAKKDKQKAKYTAKLKKSSDQKDDIISAISHEFKNPIAVINGYCQTLLNDKNINPKIREKFLTKIEANGKKLSLLIDKLRLSIRLDEKKLTPDLISANVYKLSEQVIDDIKQNFSNRNIILKGEQNVFVDMDPTLMEVAIANIIENALKYSEEAIEVAISENAISIKDSGIGISKAELENITKKFYRVSNNSWNNSLGLGLSIVLNIMKIHNFKLQIQSEESSGSTFTIFWS
ncbi:MAG: HAMP domain-containing histidine kinase [Campylobacteraceae bacterium]|nr:HAMP domain-containing histidine kinase [Campylobacteraceae bacterium]